MDRLEFLNNTSFDVVEHEVVDEVEWIKNMMKNNLSDSAAGKVSQLHVIEVQLDRLMQGALSARRLEVKAEQQKRVDDEINSYLYKKSGLHYIKLNPRYPLGEPLFQK